MPSTRVVKDSKIIRSPRVVQVEGMFDIPLSQRSEIQFEVNLPIEEFDWHIGLIVGASGSGKSTVARELFGDKLDSKYEWDGSHALIDAFPKNLSISQITELLGAVGFNTAPNWLRPFHTLSNGEQFRVSIARALAESDQLVVIDEFTSVVDRQVAQIASHCIQKLVRKQGRQFVAVSCHYDIIDWLNPDWIYEPAQNRFERGCLRRRPELSLEIYPIRTTDWRYFEKYHYLSRTLHRGSTCFGGFINGQCVAFIAYIHFPHPQRKDIKMVHRVVVHPDYQGLKIGSIMMDFLGEYVTARGYRLHCVTAHPGMSRLLAKSPRWNLLRSGILSSGGESDHKCLKHILAKRKNFSNRRISHSFRYVPKA